MKREHRLRPYERCLVRSVNMSRADDIHRWCDLLQVTSAKLTYAPDSFGPDSIGPDSIGPDFIGLDTIGLDAVGVNTGLPGHHCSVSLRQSA